MADDPRFKLEKFVIMIVITLILLGVGGYLYKSGFEGVTMTFALAVVGIIIFSLVAVRLVLGSVPTDKRGLWIIGLIIFLAIMIVILFPILSSGILNIDQASILQFKASIMGGA